MLECSRSFASFSNSSSSRSLTQCSHWRLNVDHELSYCTYRSWFMSHNYIRGFSIVFASFCIRPLYPILRLHTFQPPFLHLFHPHDSINSVSSYHYYFDAKRSGSRFQASSQFWIHTAVNNIKYKLQRFKLKPLRNKRQTWRVKDASFFSARAVVVSYLMWCDGGSCYFTAGRNDIRPQTNLQVAVAPSEPWPF